MRILRRVFKYGVIVLAVYLTINLIYSLIWPGFSDLQSSNPAITAFMKFREKQWKDQGKTVNLRKTWAPLSKISPYLLEAVIIAEDDMFRVHKGFDFEAMRRAMEENWRRKRLSFGGSTITQQLAKNLYLSPSRNPVRKLREAVLTWRLERILTKNRILEIYLNVIEWGEGIFGAEAAAAFYFGKRAADLNPEEAAWLAAVVPSPLRYGKLDDSPYLAKRTRDILEIMRKREII